MGLILVMCTALVVVSIIIDHLIHTPFTWMWFTMVFSGSNTTIVVVTPGRSITLCPHQSGQIPSHCHLSTLYYWHVHSSNLIPWGTPPAKYVVYVVYGILGCSLILVADGCSNTHFITLTCKLVASQLCNHDRCACAAEKEQKETSSRQHTFTYSIQHNTTLTCKY